MSKVSASSEDYLKTIVILGGSPAKPVRSIEMARRMRVSRTAVHKALTQLKKAGLVEQAHYGQVLLTDEGFAYGQKLWKRYQYLIAFLTKGLGMTSDMAEHDACRMEHAISDDCLERWMAYIEERDLVKDHLPSIDAVSRVHTQETVGIILD